MAAQTNIETAATIQYVIDGIEDEEYNKAITIDDLKFKLEQYETMKYNAKRRHHPEKRNKRLPMTQPPTVIKRYGNCSAKEHTVTDCPYRVKGTQYFHCNKFGHIAAKCPTKNPIITNRSCNVTQVSRKRHCKKVEINEQKIITLKSYIVRYGERPPFYTI
ncbi:hypothetical protein KM043_017673 [Ampulex compressa]|nr:hypothetical protein KM043_017673 [Ampulex compressa]